MGFTLTRFPRRVRPSDSPVFIVLLAFVVLSQVVVGMIVPSKMMMRPAKVALFGYRGSSFVRWGVASETKLRRLSRHRHVYPSYHGAQQHVRLFTSSDEIAFVKTPSETDFEDDDMEHIDDDDGMFDAVDVSEDEETSTINNLPPGSNDGFYVVKTYKTSLAGLDPVHSVELERLELSPQNISVPVALMLLDPEEYPSRSRARKACRKAAIMIHRGPLAVDETTGKDVFDARKCLRARVGDRVFPGDVIAKQTRMGDGHYPTMHHKKPFDLPVMFEDDHFAIVNKPAGVVVYSHKGGGHGTMTVRAALPFVVTPPKPGTYSTLRRPSPVHRLDKPTSGLLLIAKTKPAMVDLSRQFRDRIIKKTYVAVVNGIPFEPVETAISSEGAYDLGVDVDPGSKDTWQLIDHPLDEKSATTIWRSLKYAKSLKANENYVTLVELKPKSGRYHQLRRHMAWVCERPIVGDNIYDGGGPAMHLRERGLFLCSNQVKLEHPYYNSHEGRARFDDLSEEERSKLNGIWLSAEGKVMVTVSIEIPDKFESFMAREEDRYNRLSTEAP